MHDNRCDQLADGRKLARGAALQLVGQLHHGALVSVQRLRVQGDHVITPLGAFEPGHDLGLLGFKLLHPGDELLWRHAGDHDAVNNPLHLASDLAETPFQPSAFRGCLFLEAHAFGVIDVDILGDHRGMREMLTQSLDCERLDVVEVNAAAVLA
ncbi:hypothetical protein [Bradyrhizobium manausense]|uniref:hypothetical protein n=1 Tax=Bradyrhizobium manausense TaxID=989370 RepID=UPI002011B607|nr:hypothetical protein [Bradyrhizobium manausense]